MGGIDHYGLTQRSLKIIDALPGDFSITVIIGPYYENVSEIENAAHQIRKDVELIRDKNDLYPFMKKCDMAISAGGFTLYELATLKKPMIGLSLWENQYRNVHELDNQGVIYGLNYSDDEKFNKEFAAALSNMVEDSDLRYRMAQSAGKLFDGQGSIRAAHEIRELTKSINGNFE